jgi:uncharacterized repeat protein (TIGR01451 family)
MRSKTKTLTTLGIVHLAAAVLLFLAVMLGQPVTAAGPVLGFTPTPVPPAETSIPPVETPVTTPEATPAPAPAPPSPRLTVTKVVDPIEVFPGALVTFVIRVCNVGNATADNVVVSDSLAPELEVVRASASQGVAVVVGNGVRAEFGALIPGACAELTIIARVRADVPPGTQIANVATFPDQVSNEVTVTVLGFLPESGGIPLSLTAGLLVVGVSLLAAGLALGTRNRVLR